MSSLPSGTVTFLFTDIEGSTKLAQEHPDEMPALLARHNEILDQAIKNHNGYIMRIVGDSYSAAFHNVRDAVDSALEAQKKLDKEAWSPAPIKVRMGIHTGTAKPTDDSEKPEYDGYATLALTQRVMSAGHGGQLLISQAAHDLLAGNLPESAKLVDMGEHNLKDIVQIQRIYQVNAPGLPTEFPPLKTQKIKNHNLPVKLTTFIGRERELIEAKKRLNEAKLLTLIGPGGTGKTRLSVQLGGDQLALYPDGVWMIELAPLADPALITQTIASVFGLRESPDRPLIELVTDYLRAKSALIILDNCEHLIDACARIAESLIQACANLKILASSREALGVSGETTYRVPSLSLPQDIRGVSELSSLLDYESIRLFVDRASAANPNFKLTKENASSVAQVCRRLDGIPLALELAAARARVLSAEQIAERLDDRFRLLTGGARTALPRQQTLRALIDWSYDLLSDPEKALFRRLAVFVGGWTLEAAESVCSGEGVESYEVLDLLTQLVDKSLVIAEEKDGAVRYHRLETIRQYAREKLLETTEVVNIRDRHLEYVIQMITSCDKNYMGPKQFEVDQILQDEYDNIRAAFSWALEGKPEKALELIQWVVVYRLGLARGRITELRNWCESALERVEEVTAENEERTLYLKSLKSLGWNHLSITLMNLGDHRESLNVAKKSVELARETGNQRALARGLASMGIGALYSGDPDYALEVTTESLAISTKMGFKRTQLWGVNTMMHIHNVTGNQAQLQFYKKEYQSLMREAGAPVDKAETEMDLSEELYLRGEIEESLKHVEVAIALLEEQGNRYMLVFYQSSVAHGLRKNGMFAEALSHYRQSILLWQDFGHLAAVAHQLECFGLVAMAQNQNSRAAKLFSAAEALREIANSVRTPAEQKEFEEAKSALQSQMDGNEFNKTWNEGRSITMEQAIEFALEETSE